MLFALLLAFGPSATAESVTEHPFRGITSITPIETAPRNYTAHVILIDLATPGLHFRLTPPGGDRETIRQTTLEFLEQEHAQIAINAHFFLPYPSSDKSAYLIGLAASEGRVYSEFETPEQSYALVRNAPAVNIDRSNHATVIRTGEDRNKVWTAVAGSAQILTAGKVTIPIYKDTEHPDGELTEGETTHLSNKDSWYEKPQARTAIGRNLAIQVQP